LRLGVIIATRRNYCVMSEHFAAHLNELRGPPVGRGPPVEKPWVKEYSARYELQNFQWTEKVH